MHNALKEIRPATANVPLISPIKLQGEGALSYEIVCNFWKPKPTLYLAHIEKGGAISEDMVDPVTGRVLLRIYQSYSTFSTIRSAMSYLFKSSTKIYSPKTSSSDKQQIHINAAFSQRYLLQIINLYHVRAEPTP
jgi:hypothetical protein